MLGDYATIFEPVTRKISVSVGIGQSPQPDSIPQDLKANSGELLSSVTLPQSDEEIWRWVNPNSDVGLYGKQKHDAYYNKQGYHPVVVELEVEVMQVDQSGNFEDIFINDIEYGTTLNDLTDYILSVDSRMEWQQSLDTTVGPITNEGEYHTFKAGFSTEEAFAQIDVNIAVVPFSVNANEIHTDDDRTVWFDIPGERVVLPHIEGAYGQSIKEITLPKGFKFSTTDETAVVGVTGEHDHRLTYINDNIYPVEFLARIEVSDRVDKPTNYLMLIIAGIAGLLALSGIAFYLLKKKKNKKSKF
jgi:LPXTG-motif cell wall-anchored protein